MTAVIQLPSWSLLPIVIKFDRSTWSAVWVQPLSSSHCTKKLHLPWLSVLKVWGNQVYFCLRTTWRHAFESSNCVIFLIDAERPLSLTVLKWSESSLTESVRVNTSTLKKLTSCFREQIPQFWRVILSALSSVPHRVFSLSDRASVWFHFAATKKAKWETTGGD